MSQVEFNEEVAARVEALYRIGDAVRRRRIVREALGAAAGERILDVGCGPGFYCTELADEVGPSGSVVGVDSSPAMPALAARHCGEHEGTELRPGDATSLPVDDASFVAALCVQVLEYVADPDCGADRDAPRSSTGRASSRVGCRLGDGLPARAGPSAHRAGAARLGRAPHSPVTAAHTRTPIAFGGLPRGSHGGTLVLQLRARP